MATPSEQWSIREKLCLASSVSRSGDQNWVSVSRAIKPFIEPNRSPDWFSQKNCAIQYSAMLEAVDTPKRKRSSEKGEVETPVDLLVRRMTQERIEDLRHQIAEDRRRFRQLEEEIQAIQSGSKDDQLNQIWDDIQEKKRLEEEAKEARRLAAEARRLAAEAKAAAALKAKANLQSPNKRRPPIRPPKHLPKQTITPTPPTPADEDDSTTDTEPVISVESPEPASVTPGLDEDQKSQEVDQSQPALLSSLLTAQAKEAKAAGKEVKKDNDAANLDDFQHIFTDSTKTATPADGGEKPKQLPAAAPKAKESGAVQDKEESDALAEDIVIDDDVEMSIAEEKKAEKPKVPEKVDESQPPKEMEDDSKKTAGEKTTTDPEITPKQEPEAKAAPEVRKPEPTGGGKLLRPSLQDPVDMEPLSPGAPPKLEKKRGRGRPPNSARKSARAKQLKQDDDDDETIVSLDDLKDDARSEAADSEDHDRPSESDDASVVNMSLQTSLFGDSLPNSPSSFIQSEEDHVYRLWRKAIMMVWRQAASHKYASIFLHPVTDDIATGYTSIVHQPMDLVSIKKRIENGTIRTTEAFQRTILLMFQNAIMYNSSDHNVHSMAVNMQTDVINSIEEFISTQLLSQQPDASKSLRGRESMARRSEGTTPKDDEVKTRRSSTDHPETSGKKRRTRADEL